MPQPVSGTVVVEASPWVEDNQWILDLAAKDNFIVGFVGNLKPGEDAFTGHLKRFAANPLYRGIRERFTELRGTDYRIEVTLGDATIAGGIAELALGPRVGKGFKGRAGHDLEILTFPQENRVFSRLFV